MTLDQVYFLFPHLMLVGFAVLYTKNLTCIDWQDYQGGWGSFYFLCYIYVFLLGLQVLTVYQAFIIYFGWQEIKVQFVAKLKVGKFNLRFNVKNAKFFIIIDIFLFMFLLVTSFKDLFCSFCRFFICSLLTLLPHNSIPYCIWLPRWEWQIWVLVFQGIMFLLSLRFKFLLSFRLR